MSIRWSVFSISILIQQSVYYNIAEFLRNRELLAGGERTVQGEHFELFTVAITLKMREIRSFQNFGAISKKKTKKFEYLGNG